MQKKIIALAVAGLVSGAAFAQTNVTVYGVADAAYTYSKQGSAKFSGIESGGWNGSRIGFKGEEALGNGLKAVFTYEFGNNIDTDSGLTSTRLSFVGLSGGFGTISLGRQASPSYIFLGGTSSNDITTVYPTNLALNRAFNTLSTGSNGRWNNSVAWSSPNWSGFDVRAIYGFGENVRDSYSDASTDASKLGLGARYANGPLYLTAIYEKVLDNDGSYDSIDYNIDGSDAYAIGGSYDFKVVKLFANYLYEKQDNYTATDDRKRSLWSAGLAVPVTTNGTVRLEYMQYKVKVDDSAKAKGFGIGYDYDFSKRTRLYTAVSKIKNDDGMSWGYNKSDLTAYSGDNSTNFQVGIRHFF